MSTRSDRPTRPDTADGPDRLHVLPHPRLPIDPGAQPLVGNESVDDNLAELLRVAMWNAIGTDDRTVDLAVRQGVVTLSGVLGSAALIKKLEAAVAAVPGIVQLRNLVQVSATMRQPGRSAPRRRRGPEPFVYVTRFCGLDEASTAAAIREAVAEFDALFAATGAPPGKELIVVFRNRLPEAITLDIGMPIPSVLVGRLGEEFRAGYLPAGPLAQALPTTGLTGVLKAGEQLIAQAYPGRRDAFHGFWQRFRSPQFRPWQGHVPVPVFIDVAAEQGDVSHT